VTGRRLLSPVAASYLPIVVAAGLLALVPLRYGDSRSQMGVATVGLVFAAYAVSFNVIFGSTGQLFLCVGALAGLGGYSSVLLSDRVGLPLVMAMVAAAVIVGAVGGLLSWIAVSRSLGTIFTGIVTLTFSLAFGSLLLGLSELTGGETGLRVEAGSGTFLREDVPPYYTLLALVVAYLVLYRYIQRSRLGWAFRALRDDEVAAELAGVNVTRYRVYGGLLGSAMLGFAGALYAHTEVIVSPTKYAFADVDVVVLVMLAFGGIGTVIGPVVGAVTFTVIDELLVSSSQLRPIIYGFVIIVLFLGFRRGVVPAVATLAARLRRARAER
jgi:branched-chain amino acid transport system permease protein